jgi:carbamoyl-phosphate synthase small subunit
MEPFFAAQVWLNGSPAAAEVVFTTNMTGYQEVFTDPSYSGQIVVMTAPQIGNYGVNTDDPESAGPQIAGVVVREMSRSYSNWRATGDLLSWLTAAQVPVISEVDTRRLTRHLRSVGVMRGVIGRGNHTRRSDARRARRLSFDGRARPGLGRQHPRTLPVGKPSRAPSHRRVRFRDQAEYPAVVRRERLPRDGRSIRYSRCRRPGMNPDGVFLSNGPGDPDAVKYAPRTISASPRAKCRCSASAWATS